MAIVTMKALLESGVHFGHRTHKWHPKMKPYIFTERNSIHIIDLQQTVKALEEGYELVRDIVAEGGTVLMVGTKRQAQETVHDEAVRAGMPFVTNRWLGGMLTNWRTIRQRVNELEQLERMRDTDEISSYSKKMQSSLNREYRKMYRNLNGMRTMNRLPECLVVIDPRKEKNAIAEAQKLGITTVSLIDTDCDPDQVDLPIPGNDDSIRSIELITSLLADAVLAGKNSADQVKQQQGEGEVSAPA